MPDQRPMPKDCLMHRMMRSKQRKSSCIDYDILRDFLIKHRAEVKDVCITEFNEEAMSKAGYLESEYE